MEGVKGLWDGNIGQVEFCGNRGLWLLTFVL